MARKVRYQTLEVFFANGTTSGIKSDVAVTLDPSYGQVEGVATYETEDGGVPTYEIGLYSEQSTPIQERTDKNDWLTRSAADTQTSLSHTERYKPVDGMPAQGKKYNVSVKLPAALSADLRFYMVFKLVSGE